MTPDQVNQAVYSAITGSGESIIEGTIVALLPMLWFALIATHSGAAVHLAGRRQIQPEDRGRPLVARVRRRARPCYWW
jgi:hypothetical protein